MAEICPGLNVFVDNDDFDTWSSDLRHAFAVTTLWFRREKLVMVKEVRQI